ncbi:MAG: endonuclease/exonuclease/phosphatase family protein, partial [Marinilabiliaceae bacterium]|nr:endonuclease/exonuclease/phosphatase family protein [Marinilabiliaceae bacterium]
MKYIIRILFFVLLVVVAIATEVTYISSFVQPEKLDKYVFIQYAFPYLWMLNALLALLALLFVRRWWVVIPIAVAAMTYSGIRSVVSPHFGSNETTITKMENQLKVLSFNAHVFSMCDVDKVESFLLDVDADILCMQEYVNGNTKFLEQLKQHYEYCAFGFYGGGKICHTGNQQVVFSHYPLQLVDTRLDWDLGSVCQCVDIHISKDNTVRLYNCHLASTGIKVESTGSVPDIYAQKRKADSGKKEQLKDVYFKMFGGYLKRQHQVEAIVNLVNATEMPMMLVGDCNDYPISYTYQTIKKSGLTDSFMDKGRGIGNTFNGDLPPLRIDYVWYSGRYFSAASYLEHSV